MIYRKVTSLSTSNGFALVNAGNGRQACQRLTTAAAQCAMNASMPVASTPTTTATMGTIGEEIEVAITQNPGSEFHFNRL